MTQAVEDRIEDVSAEALVFQSVRKGLTTNVTEAVTDGTLEETMHGASGLTLELLDREYEALQSGLFGTRVVCTLDGTTFRLTKVSIVDEWKLSALFEHRLVAEMREHTGPLKAARGKMTRAEFILEMLRELKLPFRFICPELHKHQAAPAPETKVEKVESGASSKIQTTATSLAEVGRGQGFPSSANLTVKGHTASDAQKKVVAVALEGARNVNASQKAMEALVVALIFENECSNPDPGNSGDRGALSLIDSTIHGIQKKTGSGTINPYDIAEVSEHFIAAGFAGHGGANAIARAQPSASATRVAYLVQAPAAEYPHTSEAEAKAWVEAYAGGSDGAAFGGTFTEGGSTQAQTVTQVRTAKYEFTRGKPGEAEDTFTCALRLAEEVGWRFFVAGKQDIYFVNDDDLLKAAPRYLITPTSEGFVGLTFDVEVGNRKIIVKGKRQPKPSEAVLRVRADRWAAPPGCVVELEGWGPADHPWLVDSVERHLFDADTTINLRAPQHPLEEPKATISGEEASSSKAGSEDATGAVTSFPAGGSGNYRNPPTQGPKGTGTFEGVTVALWTIPQLKYARARSKAWKITSGYGAAGHVAGSEHAGDQYPHAAIDFGGPEDKASRDAFFKASVGFTGLYLIPAQFTSFTIGGRTYPTDYGHASGTGH